MVQKIDNLPAEILEQRRFVPVGQSKVPKIQSWNDPANWRDYDEINGLCGFVTTGTSLLVLDFDHVILENGALHPDVKPVLQRIWKIGATYAEASISGRGLHLVYDLSDYSDDFPAWSGNTAPILFMNAAAYKNLPRDEQDRQPKIEVYFKVGKYFLLTGSLLRQSTQRIARDETAAQVFREVQKIAAEQSARFGEAVVKNTAGTELQILQQRASPRDIEKLKAVLPFLDPDNRDVWILVGQVVFNLNAPFEIWDEWSRGSSKYNDGRDQDTRTKWSGFKYHMKYHLGRLIAIAQDNGYVSRRPKDFPPLQPFEKGDLDALPEFPTECFPDVIRAFVSDVSEVIEMPLGLVACQVLAVLGAACMGRFRIQLKPGWINETNLYIMGIGEPGDSKSSGLRPCVAPLQKWIREENLKREPEIRNSAARIRFLEKELAAIEKQIGTRGRRKGKKEYTAETALDEWEHGNVAPETLAEKQAELDEAKESAVKPVTFFQDDITAEALSYVMDANEGKAVVLSAEGGFIDILSGRYSSGQVNLDLVNKAFDGEFYSRTRVTGGAINLEHPLATIGLFVQPRVISMLFGSEDFRGRGFVSRFLYAYPKPVVGYRTMVDRAENAKARADYEDLIMRALSIPDEAKIIILRPKAADKFRSFRLSIEEQLRPEGALSEVRDIANRIAGNTGRIIALLHVARYVEQAAEIPVSEEEVENAVRIGRYFLNHMLYVTGDSAEPPAVKDAKYILQKIQGRDADTRDNRDSIPQRELQRLCRRFHSKEEMQPGLEELQERGYIRIEKQKKTGGNVILLNPEAIR